MYPANILSSYVTLHQKSNLFLMVRKMELVKKNGGEIGEKTNGNFNSQLGEIKFTH